MRLSETYFLCNFYVIYHLLAHISIVNNTKDLDINLHQLFLLRVRRQRVKQLSTYVWYYSILIFFIPCAMQDFDFFEEN